MLSQILLVCGNMPETAEGIRLWAECNFMFLIFVVLAAVAFLFILAMIEILTLFRYRKI